MNLLWGGEKTKRPTDVSEISLEELLNQKITVASKKTQKVEEAPAIISVITKREIIDRGYLNIYDALTSLPGINAIETYFGSHQLFFRGIYSPLYNDKSLVLLNGHPFWDAIQGSYYIESFPIESVKRIEVIRGPGSTLYGTNAFAGVINIVTETGEDVKNEPSGFFRYGTGKTFESNVIAGNTKKHFSWNLAIAWRHTRGYNVENAADEVGTPFSFPSVLNYKSFYGEMKYKTLRISTYTFQEDKSKIDVIPTYLGSMDNTRNHIYATMWMADYEKRFGKFDFKARSSFNNFDMDFDSLLKGVTPQGVISDFTRVENRSQRIDTEINMNYTLSKQSDVMIGAGFENLYTPKVPIFIERKTGKIITPLSSMTGSFSDTTYFSFIQGNLAVGEHLNAVAGFRYVYNKGYGGFLNPRGGIVYKLSKGLFFKALYGTAFRAPTLNEKYLNFFTTLGNMELDPEKLKTLEFGFDFLHKTKSIRLNFYHTWIEDLIGRMIVPNSPGITQYTNLAGTSKYYGVEAEIRGGLTKYFQFYINAYLGKGKDQNGFTIDYIPSFIQNGGITFKNRVWVVSAYYNYLNSVENMISSILSPWSAPRKVKISSTFLVNMKVEFTVDDTLSVSLIGHNLTDKHVLAPEFVRKNIDSLQNGPGRSITVELRKSF